jgi:predicted regulator of Ras-like GTPase activity (Roadblock/LC7/MglB family)
MVMNPIPQGSLDLSAYLAEVNDREAAVVLAAEGLVLASDIDSIGREPDWLEDVLALAQTMSSLLDDSTASGLDRGLVEGSKRKLVIHRSPKLGCFVVIIGRETMDIGLAGLAAKKIASEMESGQGSKK